MHRNPRQVLDHRLSRHRAELSPVCGWCRYNSTRIANDPGGYGFNNVYSAEMSVTTTFATLLQFSQLLSAFGCMRDYCLSGMVM